jgi:hypothetical protein
MAHQTRRRIVAVTTMYCTFSAGDLLRHRCDDLVAAEVERLARRVPGLSSGHLRHLEAALGRVIDDLVLSRASAVRDEQLAVLFDLPDTG